MRESPAPAGFEGWSGFCGVWLNPRPYGPGMWDPIREAGAEEWMVVGTCGGTQKTITCALACHALRTTTVARVGGHTGVPRGRCREGSVRQGGGLACGDCGNGSSGHAFLRCCLGVCTPPCGQLAVGAAAVGKRIQLLHERSACEVLRMPHALSRPVHGVVCTETACVTRPCLPLFFEGGLPLQALQPLMCWGAAPWLQ